MIMQVMVYKMDPNIKIVDEQNCAILYNACKFEGDAISICDRIDSLPKEGWQKPVRSFKLPDSRVLKLFTEEKLEGKVATFRQSEECLEEYHYSFA